MKEIIHINSESCHFYAVVHFTSASKCQYTENRHDPVRQEACRCFVLQWVTYILQGVDIRQFVSVHPKFHNSI
jgi:hypothetical protein